jgi:chloride channel 7
MVIGIGVCTGAAAFLLGILIQGLSKIRWGFAWYLAENGHVGLSFMYFSALAVVYVGIASYLTAFVSPAAAGSGIPEVKAYLNGINVPNVLSVKTLMVKLFGVALSFTGGLCIGKEGPLV